MSRATTTLVVGAMLVALAAGVALAWMVLSGPALAWTIQCSDTFRGCRGSDKADPIAESSVDDSIVARRGDDDVDAARFAEDTDKVSGGRGADTINTADGDPFDAIRCGYGQDVAIFDPGDDASGGCENLTPTTGGPGPAGGGR